MGNSLVSGLPSSLSSLDRSIFIKSIIEFLDDTVPSEETFRLLFGLENGYPHAHRTPYFQKDLAIFRDLRFTYIREEAWSPPSWENHDNIARQVLSLVSTMSQAERLISLLVTAAVDLLKNAYSREAFNVTKRLVQILCRQLEVICICCGGGGEGDQNPSNFPSASIWFNRLDLCVKGFDLLNDRIPKEILPSQLLFYFRGNDFEIVLLVLLLQEFIDDSLKSLPFPPVESMLQTLEQIQQFYNEIIIPCPKEFTVFIQWKIMLLSMAIRRDIDCRSSFSHMFEQLAQCDASWQPAFLYSCPSDTASCSICKFASFRCIPGVNADGNHIAALKQSIKEFHPNGSCEGEAFLKQLDMRELHSALLEEHYDNVHRLICSWEHQEETAADLIKILIKEVLRRNKPQAILDYPWSQGLGSKIQEELECHSTHDKENRIATDMLLQVYIKYGKFSEACKLAKSVSLEESSSRALQYSNLALLTSTFISPSESTASRINHFILQHQNVVGNLTDPTQICLKLLTLKQVKLAIDLSLIANQVTPLIIEWLAASSINPSLDDRSWTREVSRSRQYVLGDGHEEVEEICILRFLYQQHENINVLLLFIESCLKGGGGVSIPSWILDCVAHSGSEEAINTLCQYLALYGHVDLLLASLRQIQPSSMLRPETITAIRQCALPVIPCEMDLSVLEGKDPAGYAAEKKVKILKERAQNPFKGKGRSNPGNQFASEIGASSSNHASYRRNKQRDLEKIIFEKRKAGRERAIAAHQEKREQINKELEERTAKRRMKRMKKKQKEVVIKKTDL